MRSALLLVGVLLAATGCGDDGEASGGGGPGDDGATATATSGETSSASATTAAASGSTTTSAASTSVASSSSTGEPGLCSWAGMDPGNLVATGAALGDVIENLSGLVDQCGVTRSLWDFAGGYRILSMTPGW